MSGPSRPSRPSGQSSPSGPSGPSGPDLRRTRRSAAELGLMEGAPPFEPGRAVTLANWEEPPYNRWGFQHVRDLIPTARIRHDHSAVWHLPTEPVDLSGVRLSSAGRGLTVAEMLEETYTDAFLVVHRGRTVTEQYFNGMEPDTTHLLMSVSKSVTSTVVGILAGRGVIDTSARIETIVPELAGSSFDGATVQHLLDMRTGTRFDESYDDPKADVRVYEQVYQWCPRTDRHLPPDALSYFLTLRNDTPHGGAFRYRSVLTDVLGWVAERAAGARLHELISKELWMPMGAEFDAEITVDAGGNAMADGGMCATLRDLARLGLLMLRRRPSGGREIVPDAWIDDTVKGAPDGPRAFREGDRRPGYPKGAHYRNCWWVRDPSVPMFQASGVHGQSLFIHVPSDTVVAKLSSWPASLSQGISRTTLRAFQAIVEALGQQG